jgi:hypothetical protein
VPTFQPAPGPRPAKSAKPMVDVCRVHYNGNWEPEPVAWVRFSRLVEYRTGLQPRVRATRWVNLAGEKAPFAHLTGTAKYLPNAEEVAALRAYVEGGGVLLIDNCGPNTAFTGGLRDVLTDAFGVMPVPIPPDHPILNAGAPGMSALSPPTIRKYASDLLKRDVPPIEAIYAGKGTLLISKLDVTSGLLGTDTWGIMGYASKWCEAFVQNALFWTMDGQATVPGGRLLRPTTRPVDSANAAR